MTRGEVVTDPDGTRWIIVFVFAHGISRVQVGSLAASIIFPEHEEGEE